MSKHLFLVTKEGTLSDTYLYLEDDLLSAIYPVLEANPQCHLARALLEDFYGDEEFSHDQLANLAAECSALATLLNGAARPWLTVIAALASGAAEQRITLRVIAD